eukprot:COSAG02_NODE_2375_length_9016_cov_3.763598_6_plen_74_part_00
MPKICGNDDWLALGNERRSGGVRASMDRGTVDHTHGGCHTDECVQRIQCSSGIVLPNIVKEMVESERRVEIHT